MWTSWGAGGGCVEGVSADWVGGGGGGGGGGGAVSVSTGKNHGLLHIGHPRMSKKR